MTNVENLACVVLNASFEPLSVVSSSRALVLVFDGRATVVENHPSLIFRSATQAFPAPVSVVLREYKKSRPAFRAPAQLTQRNLFIRDKHTCVYCNRERKNLGRSEFLTRDHVHPLSKGGRDVWTNVVTACNKCNNKKANMMLEDVDMKLPKIPNVPSVFEIWSRNNKNLRQLPNY